MFKSNTLLLCFMAIGCRAVHVSFIDKCARTDKACMITSAQKAVPFLAAGIPSLGLSSLDPMKVESASYEGNGLSFTFIDNTVTELSKCKVVEINRDVESELIISVECPVDHRGNYTASGKLLNIVAVEGEGPYIVTVENVAITLKLGLTYVDGSDGQKHWKIQEQDITYESTGNAVMDIQNLFNGDEAKAAPIKAIIAISTKVLISTVGRPLVYAIVREVIKHIQILFDLVPAKELEI